MKKYFGWVVWWVLSPVCLFAGKYYDFSPRAKAVYQQIYTLKLEEARASLNTMAQQEPDNLIALFLENYIEALKIGLDDDETEYNRKLKGIETRIYQLSKGEPRSPYMRYTQAEVRLQWAILHARFGKYLSCAHDIKLAYALLEENTKRFPDFIANKKSLGALHALLGNVPNEYRWAVRLLSGMKGNMTKGLTELREVLTYAQGNEFIFEPEAIIAFSLIQLHFNNQSAQAWNTLKNGRLNPKSSPLAAYVMAVVALRIGRSQEALTLLQESPGGSGVYPHCQKNYLMGMAKLYRLDADANQAFLQFLTCYKGKNGIKEVYQKLAWHQLLQQDKSGYEGFMWQVKQRGSNRTEPDKVAWREANAGEMPDGLLLKGRLLFDGGYYQKALDLLQNNQAAFASHHRNLLEYNYRMGRIYHKLGKLDDAIPYYERTVQTGEKTPWYFACNAALQLGLLYEEKRTFDKAAKWYATCLKLQPEEYAASLHAKAKAGINRLK